MNFYEEFAEKSMKSWQLIVLVALFALSLSACGPAKAGGSTNPTQAATPVTPAGSAPTKAGPVATTAPAATQKPEPTSMTGNATNPVLHKIGEVVVLADRKITLNSANITNNILKANFTVKNTENTTFYITAYMSFQAKRSDNSALDPVASNCGTNLDGAVQVGSKLVGDSCWQTGGAKGIKLFYYRSLADTNPIVWSFDQ